MFCMNRKCGRKAPLPDDETVCPDCGFDNENWEMLHALITCEACGEENSQTSVTCWNCGITLVVKTDSGDRNSVCVGCGATAFPTLF